MLTLSSRVCSLARKYGGDTAVDDAGHELRMLKLELNDIPLDRQELCALLGDPKAYPILYDTEVEPHEPRLQCFKAMEFRDSIVGAVVKIEFGHLLREIKFKRCVLKKLKLSLNSGGESYLSCKLEGAPEPWNRLIPELLEECGRTVHVEIRADNPRAQQELPLNRFGKGEQPEQKH